MHHGLDRRRVQKERRHRPAEGSDGAPAAQGSGREGEDGAVDAGRDGDQPAVRDRRPVWAEAPRHEAQAGSV